MAAIEEAVAALPVEGLEVLGGELHRLLMCVERQHRQGGPDQTGGMLVKASTAARRDLEKIFGLGDGEPASLGVRELLDQAGLI
jgi:hypothetical protein